jgi:chorismate dehydratase
LNKIRISAVSYANSRAFIYGLEHSEIRDRIDLSLDIPSDCADKLINDQADIGLVPSAILPEIPGSQIVADYCIGAYGAVDSVFIFSDKPVYEIDSLRLDPQSRTSNRLAQVLLKYYWHHEPQYITEGPSDAFVLIGDRTFGKKNQFEYEYDLAEVWKEFTGLPFVFAVWASNKAIDEDFKAEFNKALKFGLDHRREVIGNLSGIDDFDLEDYLMNKIDFDLDAKKLEALEKFHAYVREL